MRLRDGHIFVNCTNVTILHIVRLGHLDWQNIEQSQWLKHNPALTPAIVIRFNFWPQVANAADCSPLQCLTQCTWKLRLRVDDLHNLVVHLRVGFILAGVRVEGSNLADLRQRLHELSNVEFQEIADEGRGRAVGKDAVEQRYRAVEVLIDSLTFQEPLTLFNLFLDPSETAVWIGLKRRGLPEDLFRLNLAEGDQAAQRRFSSRASMCW